jgi:hypothetical protein
MSDGTEKEEEYLYKQSEIRERHGYIPWWLKLVVLVLLVWSIYYLVRFWSTW